LAAPHESHGLGTKDIVEALDSAIQHPRLLDLIEERAQRNCGKIVEERMRLRKRLERDGLTKGLEGFDAVSCASQDMLAVTLYVPRKWGI